MKPAAEKLILRRLENTDEDAFRAYVDAWAPGCPDHVRRNEHRLPTFDFTSGRQAGQRHPRTRTAGAHLPILDTSLIQPISKDLARSRHDQLRESRSSPICIALRAAPFIS